MKKLMDTIKKIKNNIFVRIITILIKIVLYVIFGGLVLITIVQKVSNNNLSVGGFRIYSVATGSMEPVYKVGDILVSKTVNQEDLKIGDDVTYMGEKGDFAGILVTHRIIDIRKENDELFYVTKGTANESADPKITFNQVYGKVVTKLYVLSFISRVMTNIVWYFVIFIVVGIIFSFQVVRMIYDHDEDDENETIEKKD